MGLLTAKQVDNAKVDEGKAFKVLTDGNGLYLRIPSVRARGVISAPSTV